MLTHSMPAWTSNHMRNKRAMPARPPARPPQPCVLPPGCFGAVGFSAAAALLSLAVLFTTMIIIVGACRSLPG